jgi:hypothetical protein
VRQIEISAASSRSGDGASKSTRRHPRSAVWFEVYPEGSPLAQLPDMENEDRSRVHEIVHVDIGKLFVDERRVQLHDSPRHDRGASNITSQVTVTRAEDLYEGIIARRCACGCRRTCRSTSDLRGGFRYTPGVLRAAVDRAARARHRERSVNGQLRRRHVRLRIDSRLALERMKEIFRIEPCSRHDRARHAPGGKDGRVTLTGGWVSQQIVADAYEARDAKGGIDLNPRTLTSTSTRPDTAAERSPRATARAARRAVSDEGRSPLLRHLARAALRRLDIEDSGLRAAATGNLSYHWNKDNILEGAGEGTARLAKNAVAFSNAKYPIPIAASTDFALDRGTITFRRAELDTDVSHMSSPAR